MTWLTPMFAAVAASIAIPSLLILYFLKLRRRDLEVSTTLLWKKAIEDLHANAPFQRLRRNLLLFLQLLILAAALLAIGQPEVKTQAAAGSRNILLIDRSASMSAVDATVDGSDKPVSRLQAAKEAARRIVDAMREPSLFDLGSTGQSGGDQAMVIAFGAAADATVVHHFTTNKSVLLAAIENLTPTDQPSRLMPAIKLAKSYVPRVNPDERARGMVVVTPSTIHVFSDGQLPDSQDSATSPDDPGAEDLTGEDVVVYHAVGDAESINIGITELRAERSFDKPGRVTVFAGIQSTSKKEEQLDLQLLAEGTEPAVARVTLPAADAQAPAVSGARFVLDRPDGAIVTVRIMPTTGSAQLGVLPTDDVAYLVVPPARRLSVGLVTDGNLFLRTALESVNLSNLYVLSFAQYERMLAGERIETIGLSDVDVFVLDGDLPTIPSTDGARAAALPPGRVLALGVVPPQPFCLLDQGAGDYTEIIDWRADHPALRHAGLANLRIGKGRRVNETDDAQSDATVLAQSSLGPAIFETDDADTNALVVAFNPADSDWAFSPGWIMFLADSITYLAGGGGGSVGSTVRPGDTLSTRIPLDAAEPRVALPDRSVASLIPAADGSVSHGPLRTIGMHNISWLGSRTMTDMEFDGRASRPFASNLMDPDESEVATVPNLALAGRIVTASNTAETPVAMKLWPWLLLAALFIVMVEWYVYNRKVYL